MSPTDPNPQPSDSRPYSELSKLDDVLLVEEMQRQNGDALAVLFRRYRNLVMSIAVRILEDRGEAEEILQRIFLEIYQQARQFDPAKGTFLVWLQQYAYHRSFSQRKYLIVRQFYADHAIVTELSQFDQGSLKLYSRPTQECVRFVREALELLSEAQKCTIEMVHFEGLSLKDAATRRNESFSNVSNHYYRGLAKLRIHLRSVRDGVERAGSPAADLGLTDV